jgi:hypothetical protein
MTPNRCWPLSASLSARSPGVRVGNERDGVRRSAPIRECRPEVFERLDFVTALGLCDQIRQWGLQIKQCGMGRQSRF